MTRIIARLLCDSRATYLYFGVRQTDRQTNRWTASMH